MHCEHVEKHTQNSSLFSQLRPSSRCGCVQHHNTSEEHLLDWDFSVIAFYRALASRAQGLSCGRGRAPTCRGFLRMESHGLPGISHSSFHCSFSKAVMLQASPIATFPGVR